MLADTAHSEAIAADHLSRVVDDRITSSRKLEVEAPPEPRDTITPHPFAGISFDGAISIAQKERHNFLSALERLGDDDLLRRVRSRSGRRIRPSKWANQSHRRDARRSADLARWRATLSPLDPTLRTIHSTLLRPILTLSRHEFLALASLIPPDERETRPLEGIWTLKQMIGHLADYEGLGIVALRAVAAGMEPNYKPPITSFDAFNNERGEVWAGAAWNEAWAKYEATRHGLLSIAGTLTAESLARPFLAPWQKITTACGYLLDMAQHEREHADGLRRALGLPTLPHRLGRG